MKTDKNKSTPEVTTTVMLPDMLDRQTVTLNQALVRGTTKITEIQVRTPASGEMRKISMSNLLQLDVDELTVLLPRITAPTITSQEVSALHPSDLLQLGTKVIGFLVPESKEVTLTA